MLLEYKGRKFKLVAKIQNNKKYDRYTPYIRIYEKGLLFYSKFIDDIDYDYRAIKSNAQKTLILKITEEKETLTSEVKKIIDYHDEKKQNKKAIKKFNQLNY